MVCPDNGRIGRTVKQYAVNPKVTLTTTLTLTLTLTNPYHNLTLTLTPRQCRGSAFWGTLTTTP